jgi:small GTP-binding protein
MSILSRKICLVGDFAVGKTSLIRRFVEQQFSDDYLSTVGVKMSRKTVEVPIADSQQTQEILFVIWDIEGSTKFKAMAPTYFQGAKGAIVVGDVTQPETLNNIPEHIQSFVKVNPKSNIAIALNKSDLIEAEYLDSILKTYQQKFCDIDCVSAIYLTSAKKGNNVDELFKILAKSVI